MSEQADAVMPEAEEEIIVQTQVDVEAGESEAESGAQSDLEIISDAVEAIREEHERDDAEWKQNVQNQLGKIVEMLERMNRPAESENGGDVLEVSTPPAPPATARKRRRRRLKF